MRLDSVMSLLIDKVIDSRLSLSLVLCALICASSLASASSHEKTAPDFRNLKSTGSGRAKMRADADLYGADERSSSATHYTQVSISEEQIHQLISQGYVVENHRLSNPDFDGEVPNDPVKDINPHYLVFVPPTVDEIKQYILTKADADSISQMGVDFESYADLLAKKIDVVTRCFDIDPWIFASMIFHESGFDAKECYRGGCGLTQFTTDGIQGVESVIGSYTQAIRCTDVAQFTTKRWTDLRDRHGLSTAGLRRRAMQHDTNAALIYGAIYLKLQMDELGFPTRFNNLRTYYEAALRDYNGNKRRVRGVQVRDRYKKVILQYAQAVSSEIRGT